MKKLLIFSCIFLFIIIIVVMLFFSHKKTTEDTPLEIKKKEVHEFYLDTKQPKFSYNNEAPHKEIKRSIKTIELSEDRVKTNVNLAHSSKGNYRELSTSITI
ncbi:hypothetical protein LO80_04950 [Candidatus Francisella endociliophora]|uniref:Uncharacterized protein n=1 Tax=Candidatus Francisella endociliophora TaxID=653937 RepID=A0A097EP88_9GAMM|nr:hypothetical protein [Francisella sp. FSC1006]AIT09378.1 hypothetical protein LO80_04950 [Francisella sp. FSC1006]